jgi:polyphosphate kinase 2 (PPK2 family)
MAKQHKHHGTDKKQADDKGQADDAPRQSAAGGSDVALLERMAGDEPATAPPKMKQRDFEDELAKLQVELVKLQEWVKSEGKRIVIVFEGRDTAGKGGTIKRITERVSPRVFRVVALPAPTDRERSQMYLQRYLPHLPAAGEIVIFDPGGRAAD